MWWGKGEWGGSVADSAFWWLWKIEMGICWGAVMMYLIQVFVGVQ